MEKSEDMAVRGRVEAGERRRVKRKTKGRIDSMANGERGVVGW